MVIPELKAGEKMKVPVLLYGSTGTISSAVVGGSKLCSVRMLRHMRRTVVAEAGPAQ